VVVGGERDIVLIFKKNCLFHIRDYYCFGHSQKHTECFPHS